MKKKYCPYCDQEITGIYCRGCKRLVLHPYEQETDYYLNTQHPVWEEICQFHGDLQTGAMPNRQPQENRQVKENRRPQENRGWREPGRGLKKETQTGRGIREIVDRGKEFRTQWSAAQRKKRALKEENARPKQMSVWVFLFLVLVVIYGGDIIWRGGLTLISEIMDSAAELINGLTS